MAQRIPRKKSFNEEIDEFSDEGEGDNVGQKFITVHKSVTHIGVINGPVVIGPQFNNTHNPMQPSTWFNQQVSFNFYIFESSDVLKVAQINYVSRIQHHCTANLNFDLMCKKAKHCWALSTNFSFLFS